MTKTATELLRVKRAAAARQRAEREYKDAMQAARVAGYSLAEIADVAGVSRQNVRQVTARAAIEALHPHV